METTQSGMSNEDLALLAQAERYDNPVKFLQALVDILMEGANAIRVGIVLQEENDDSAALWFKCDTGNIIIAGPREAVDMLSDNVIEMLKQAPSNNTVH